MFEVARFESAMFKSPAGARATRSCMRQRCAAALAAACASSPALAMPPCPPEAGDKSAAFWALGWAILAAFALAGLALPVLAVLLTRARRGAVRAAWALLACAAMLGCWLLGLAIFYVKFVLPC